MAIAPTGKIFKSFEFDGESSKDYGVYITGEAVYNAPERDVEMISIPGRNGSFALDKGRFENIEVTYPAGIFADSEIKFAQAISDLRNCLCSRKGYCRLTDDYNPDEFRLGIYKSGLEVSPAQAKAGEFEIKFDCKPQRYLMSGESPISVTSGDTVFNPTPFDAQPLLMVNGYGAINIGNDPITIDNVLIGNVRVAGAHSSSGSIIKFNIDTSALNTGDVISLSKYVGTLSYTAKPAYTIATVGVTSTSNATAEITKTKRTITMEPQTFAYGTSKSVTASGTFGVQYVYNDTLTTISVTNSIVVSYNGDKTFTFALSSNSPGTPYQFRGYSLNQYSMYADSTKSALGNPTYIDLDIGVAWNADGGTPVSLNNAVSIPAILPSLVPGNNTITFDNTITSLKLAPRWWKI